MRIVILALLFTLLMGKSSFTIAQNFSCNYGKEAACLDRNDKIVDSDAICYDEYVCGFGGSMICKKKYDDLLRVHNEVIEDYNQLLEKIIAWSMIIMAY